MRRLLLAVSAALVCAIGVSAQVHSRDVDIKAPDGIVLKGTFYPAGHRAPGILLLHQCNMDRHAWNRLAPDLARAGFNVLTVDYRGYGQSGGRRFSNFAQLRPIMREKWPADIEAAYEFLVKQPGVDSRVMGAGGASCGVTESADLAVQHPEIKALMLLSGHVSAKARDYIGATPGLAIFGAASQGDTGPADGIQEAVESSANTHKVLNIYPGKLHGVPMFAANPGLEPAIVAWFKARLTAERQTR